VHSSRVHFHQHENGHAEDAAYNWGAAWIKSCKAELKIWNIFKSKAGTCPQTSKVEDACISSMEKKTPLLLSRNL
jgi:hypothetical protein